MTRLALVTAFPPSRGSLNEYGFQLARALAERTDIEELLILADKVGDDCEELDLGAKVRVRRVWSFNSLSTPVDLVRAVRQERVDCCLFNIQTASFGDREIPAALGLLTPALVRSLAAPTGIILHNLIDGIELDKTAIGGNRLRIALVSIAGRAVTAAMLRANYVTVTLDRLYDILKDRYRAQNAYMVPHGSFQAGEVACSPIATRRAEVVTMGKFGTYKRLERLIEAFQSARDQLGRPDLVLRIGGSDHPATPGYVESLARQHAGDRSIRFEGYVAEDDVPAFFANARLAVFDYDSTTGSSGVLHQAAIYGTPPAYPLIGDFVDVTEREGLTGFHYAALDVGALKDAIVDAIGNSAQSQRVAESNLAHTRGLPLSTVAGFHLMMTQRIRQRRKPVMQLRERILMSDESPRPDAVWQ